MPSGPVPSKNPRRRNARPDVTQLPAEGRRAARAPNWPLPEDPRLTGLLPHLRERETALREEWASEQDARVARRLGRELASIGVRVAQVEAEVKAAQKVERTIWTALWRTPMAVQWERQKWTRTIARYARLLAAGELGDLDAAKEARQLEDRLGLTSWSLLRLRWEVAPSAEPAGGRGPGTVSNLDDFRDVLGG